jgi:endonuclease YncB( thermonuclease family)
MSKPLTILITFCFTVFYLIMPGLAWAWSGMVVDVVTGETITVLRNGKNEEVSLYGIDCPDEGQPFSSQARQFTYKMIFGKVVEVHRMDTDESGRTVALISLDKRLLNEELVKAGLAWVYGRYCYELICETWKHYQLRAKLNKRGFWSEPEPVSPWRFRRQKKRG